MPQPAVPIAAFTAHDVEAVLAAQFAHQVDITRLFSVGVDILNAARALDTMGFELQLLARNGVVQAAQLNHGADAAHAGEGQTLLALAEILSHCPRQIAPEVAGLGAHCRAIASHTATCTSLARRHTQHLKSLLLVLGREGGDAGAATLAAQLETVRLGEEAGLVVLQRVADGLQIEPVVRTNIRLIAARCSAALRELERLLEETGTCLRETHGMLHGIGRIAGTVNYLGINVAIEAAHCDRRGENFRQLAADIQATVDGFEQKLLAIRLSAERGRVLLKALGA
jgi:hypothetical protein